MTSWIVKKSQRKTGQDEHQNDTGERPVTFYKFKMEREVRELFYTEDTVDVKVKYSTKLTSCILNMLFETYFSPLYTFLLRQNEIHSIRLLQNWFSSRLGSNFLYESNLIVQVLGTSRSTVILINNKCYKTRNK